MQPKIVNQTQGFHSAVYMEPTAAWQAEAAQHVAPVLKAAKQGGAKKWALPAATLVLAGAFAAAKLNPANSESYRKANEEAARQRENFRLMDIYGDRSNLEELQAAFEAYQKH